jgi:hypothetical protein
MLDPLGGQRPAITADLPTVLLLGRMRLCHGADTLGRIADFHRATVDDSWR